MKICLVRPCSFTDYYVSYPLNIECLMAALNSEGHKVTFIDAELYASEKINLELRGIRHKIKGIWDAKYWARKNSEIVKSFFMASSELWNEISESIINENPDMIGLSCYTASMSSVKRIARAVKKSGFSGSIVAGGIHPTVQPIETLQNIPELDVLVVGEGEETIKELASALDRGHDKLKEVAGIYYRDKNSGDILKTKHRSLIEDLEDLPILEWKFSSPDYYNYIILTSRGCPFDCTFCAPKNIWGKTVRFRPAHHVVKETQNLVTKTNTRKIRFGDDTFTLRKSHMEKIFSGLKKAGIEDVRLTVGSRIDTIDPEKLKLMRDYVYHISFGIESGSQRITDYNRKRIKTSDTVPTIKNTNENGFETTTYFILNHPTETDSDIKQTLKVMKALKSCSKNIIWINIGFPYPGTPWWDYCKNNKLLGGIDFYNKSHTYNHFFTPKVNMTAIDDNSLRHYLDMGERIEKSNNNKVRARQLIRHFINDPKFYYRRLISKI